MKKFITYIAAFLLSFFFISALVFASDTTDQYDWKMMLLAENAYNKADYGVALSCLQSAKELRRKNIEKAFFTLNAALNPSEVRAEGDNINDVLAMLKKRQTTEAETIIEKLVSKKTYGFFHGSVSNLLDFLQRSNVYPEADFLTGKIYQIEGEYRLAQKYYNDAWLNREFLDIPDVSYDILYRSAELAQFFGEDDLYEKYLITIVSTDDFYKNQTLRSSIKRTIASNSGKTKVGENNVERFFSMYRAGNIKCIQAYYMLADYYKKKGLYSDALDAVSLGSLTVFSHMYELIKKTTIEYTYTNVSDFLVHDVQNRADVSCWARDQGFWDGLLAFVDIAHKNGCTKFASELLSMLQKTAPSPYLEEIAANKSNQ